MGMTQKLISFVLFGLLLAGLAGAQEKCDEGAKNRLKSAWSLKKTSFKQDKEVKREILLKTVDCYRSLLRDFPDCKAACAEACFRMGEIHRSLKMTEEAEKNFNQVLTHDRTGEFAARSLKEIGHLYRRAKDYTKAHAYYQRVLKECADQREVCADACTWIGKVWLKQNDFEKARAVFIDFVDRFPEFPDEAIRNIDLAADSYLDEDDQEAASAFITKWRAHFEAMLGKDDRMDKKIEQALAKMKTPDKIGV
jgi:tetratricopeptide (TPR) repeat protein